MALPQARDRPWRACRGGSDSDSESGGSCCAIVCASVFCVCVLQTTNLNGERARNQNQPPVDLRGTMRHLRHGQHEPHTRADAHVNTSQSHTLVSRGALRAWEPFCRHLPQLTSLLRVEYGPVSCKAPVWITWPVACGARARDSEAAQPVTRHSRARTQILTLPPRPSVVGCLSVLTCPSRISLTPHFSRLLPPAAAPTRSSPTHSRTLVAPGPLLSLDQSLNRAQAQ